MKILITGATGFIGKSLTKRLCQQGHEVWAMVRESSNTALLKGLGVKLVSADITDDESLKGISADAFDTVFHCAALVSDDNLQRLRRVNAGGTENVCRFCLRLGVKKLVYLSSVAVVSANDRVPLKEDMEYAASNNYGISKIEAEKVVLGYREKGLVSAVIRPSMVYGEGEPHAMDLLFSLIKRRLMPLIDGGRHKWHLAYVENVVELMVLAMHDQRFLEGTFFAADDEVLTVRQVFDILCKETGAPLPWSIPECLNPVLSRAPLLGPKFRLFLKDRVYDTARARALGYKEKTGASEALAITARHWRASHSERKVTTPT